MRTLLIGFSLFFLTACGTTSGVEQGGEKVKDLDLTGYDKVVVMDFGDATEDGSVPAFAGPNFADRIQAAINKTGAYSEVLRNESDLENALVISGDITRYKEGNAALKLIIGFGAGSTNFDADVSLTDTAGAQFGSIAVDKNSWALGGGLAAAQSIEGFMDGAATKIAKELARGKEPTAE
ncbi:MAG: DUF4410 domain-containing protein [Pseudomonadota bacterium]